MTTAISQSLTTHYLCSIFLLILLLLSVNSLSDAATDSDFTTFLECLMTNSSPGHRVSSIVYSPQNSSFSSVLEAHIKNKRFNTSETPKPIIIVTAKKESHVQNTVLCANKMGIQIKIRSGGHDYDGLSYVSKNTFILLDMFNIREIDVNMEEESAVVQSGATLGEVYKKISEKSEVHGFPAGICPTVGVGGHMSGGGYGNMMRKYGLTVDNVIDATIVDAKGQILDRKLMGEDLFWAIRGGGGASFGVILSYTIKLVKVPKLVSVFHITRTLDENATDIVYRYQFVADKLDKDLFVRMTLKPVTGKVKGQKTIRTTFIGMFLGDCSRLMGVMDNDFPELGLKKADCLEMSWIKSVLQWAEYDSETNGITFLKRKSDYVQTPIAKDGLESLWKKMVELGNVQLYINPYGGKMSEIPSSATPFPHRAGNIYKIQYLVDWQQEGSEADKNYMSQIRSLYSFMTPYVSNNPRRAFLNYRDVDIGMSSNGKNSYKEGEVYGKMYYGENFERLVKVKTAVDSENFFRHEQSIPVKVIEPRRLGRDKPHGIY